MRLRELRSRSGGRWGRLSEEDKLAVSLSGLSVSLVCESVLVGESVSSVIREGRSVVNSEVGVGFDSVCQPKECKLLYVQCISSY